MIDPSVDPSVDSIGLMALIWLVVFWAFGRSLFKLMKILLSDTSFMRLLGVVLLLLLSGAHIYHRVEGWNYLDSFYFTVITLTTVGYGDFSPQTALGKIFSMLYIVLGLGGLGALIGIITEKSHEWAATLQPRGRKQTIESKN